MRNYGAYQSLCDQTFPDKVWLCPYSRMLTTPSPPGGSCLAWKHGIFIFSISSLIFTKPSIEGFWGSKILLLLSLVFMCICFRALVMTYLEHLGINYIAVSEDPCPRMLIHNRCPRALLLKENLRGTVCIHTHLGKRQLCLKKRMHAFSTMNGCLLWKILQSF